MIDQLESLDINGTQQWILCRGDYANKPVVLFVHGGPGSPLMMFSRAFDDVFTKDFVVVHWDQRRSGKSFNKNVPLSTLTLEQIVADGLVVVDHLKKKFARSKIILVGHSWGTIVASHMVEERPTDFLSYVSVGTVADMAAGDELKYEFLEGKLASEPDKKLAEEFKKLGRPPHETFDQVMLTSGLLWKFGGIFHRLSADQVGVAVEKTKEYSEDEMAAQGEGMKDVFEKINAFLSTYKASAAIPKLDVPLVFVQGKFDMATPLVLAQKFIDGLNAPSGKKLILFDESAHFPMYEEPAKFLEVLKDLPR